MSAAEAGLVSVANGSSTPVADLPALGIRDFSDRVEAAVGAGQRVCAFFGAVEEGRAALYVVLADDERNRLYLGRTTVEGPSYPSLTPRCPQVHLFEREIAEQLGLRPEGHPWLKPVRYRASWTGMDAWGRPAAEAPLPAVGDFYRVEGEEAHEVAVGPVHAGVIEPGHFRFQCHGERVHHLEIALGYQHRGIEEALPGGPDNRTIHFMETAAGDTSVGHATSYCQIVEALSKARIPARAQVLRGVALELERIANHVGDLGALSGDVGYLPTASFCGRIRGDFLNLTAFLCGNRFGRGLARPGGLGRDVDSQAVEGLLERLGPLRKDTMDAVDLLWDEQSVMARFEDTGRVSRELAVELGLVGPAARASGLVRDARYDQSSGIFRLAQVPVSTCDSGDVFARAYVRALEIQRSLAFIAEQLGSLPGGEVRTAVGALEPERIAVAINEGWRGEVCHVAITDSKGKFERYKIVDPSFHNWQGLALALRGQEISDFPLCNKSFNLSYCGHDL